MSLLAPWLSLYLGTPLTILSLTPRIAAWPQDAPGTWRRGMVAHPSDTSAFGLPPHAGFQEKARVVYVTANEARALACVRKDPEIVPTEARRSIHRLDEPAEPSLGMVAFPVCP